MDSMHLYLSLIPQALIASMLPPEDFSKYYAVGSQGTSLDESIFFEVDPAFRSGDFPFDVAEKKCKANADGSPKASVYLSIHRVLSRIPVSALGKLYLVTCDGQSLALDRGDYEAETEHRLHLYQEFCPITPMVASRLEPREFCRFITDMEQPVHVPRIVFSELKLLGLATDPLGGHAGDLPYRRLSHIREALNELAGSADKPTKLVQRSVKEGPIYRMIRDGLYIGDSADFAFYPIPSPEELEVKHHDWWRSAQLQPPQ